MIETTSARSTALHDLSALEQARLVRRRAVSPVELVDHYLARIERHSATVGAFITVTADAARAQAAVVAEQVAHGSVDHGASPFAGVPIGIKDLALTAGTRTTFGSAALAEYVPDIDAAVVARIRRAGFVMVGKTNTPEFGATCDTEPVVAPPARTPWNLERSASGSSGGAAAAVASGLLPCAHASDGAGSARTPAANCGLVGYKPSRGVVGPSPNPDVLGTSTDGVLARTVPDAAALLDVISGVEIGDRFGVLRHGDAAGAPRHHLRIARCRDPGNGAAVDPDVAAAVDDAAQALIRLGHDVEDIAHPMGGAYAVIQADVLGLFAVAVSAIVEGLVPPADRELLSPYSAWLARRGAATTATEYVLSLQRLFRAATGALRALEPYDALLTPTTSAPAQPVGTFRAGDEPQVQVDAMLAWSAFTPPYNLTGQPAVSLPWSVTGDNIPIGVQLVGLAGGDAALLALAAELEGASAWQPGVHPPIWDQ